MAQSEVAFHPEASDEYREAYVWYARHDRRAAERFEREVDSSVQRIAENPDRWPTYDARHRKVLLRRFPYVLVYREHEQRIWVVAVAHGHRRPGYWKRRRIPG